MRSPRRCSSAPGRCADAAAERSRRPALGPRPDAASRAHRGHAPDRRRTGRLRLLRRRRRRRAPAGAAVDRPAHAPTLIRHGDLAAVVSRVPLADFGEDQLREHLADMAWLERTARAHEQALETSAGRRR